MKKILFLSLLALSSCKKETVMPTSETIIKNRVIYLDVWNMHTTPSISVPHSLNYDKIRSVDCIIKSDIGEVRVSLLADGTISAITPTDIVLTRKQGGGFDVTAFSGQTQSRGYLTIGYVE